MLSLLSRITPFMIALASLSMLFTLSLIVSWQESTTMDEQAHIPAAYTYVKYLDMRLNPEHPPLIKDLAGIPLLFLDVTFPTDSPEWKTGINEQWTLGNRFLHENNAHLITYLSRIPIVLIALLLGWFLYRWTSELAGAWAGALAVIFYAFNPNIIAHSHYVTTDIGIAAAIFISLYFGVRFIERPSQKNTVIFGIILGLAQLTKFSAVILYPLFGLITLLFAIANTPVRERFLSTLRALGKHIAKYWILLLEASFISLIPIWILYTFNTWNMPDATLLTLIETQLTDEGIPGLSKAFVMFLFGLPILSSLAEYFLGLAMVFVRVTGGNTYFFLGEVSNVANSAYFPTVYLLKETLPILFSLIIATLLATVAFLQAVLHGSLSLSRWRSLIATCIQRRIALLSMAIFVLLYAYLSITGNLNIGFRHLFPILPFMIVFGVLALFKLYRHALGTPFSLFMRLFIAILTLWALATPFIHYPSYLSYYNELVGGPKEGYKYVTDSNYDWGQDLKNLKKWVDTRNEMCTRMEYNDQFTCSIEKIRVDYFGGSDPAYWLGDMFIPWHETSTPEPGWYAISIGFLQESIYKESVPNQKDYKWLSGKKPYGRAGDSIFIFYIEEGDLR